MSDIEIVSQTLVFGGTQTRLRHRSEACDAPMTMTVFRPPESARAGPVVLWLSGLTCTDENMMQKAGAQRLAAQLGITLVAPDTSPRGLNLPGEDNAYDFGTGAGFYVNATVAPFALHYRMFDYVVDELPMVVTDHFGPLGPWSISGHSMGGHGALMIALRRPEQFVSASAFAPIAHPVNSPWGQKAFTGYLGGDRRAWLSYDTVELMSAAESVVPMRIDQGAADEFLDAELGHDALVDAAARFGDRVDIHKHAGYDHSYYFIASFIDAHLAFHARAAEGMS